MDFQAYFKKLGFSQSEGEIFLALYKLGTQPASVVAKNLNMERTTVYKILLKLSKENIISETLKLGVKHFFVPDISILKKYTKNKLEVYNNLEKNFGNIEKELLSYNQSQKQAIPKISIFNGNEGIKNIYQDILDNVLNNNYISIKLFASNTFDSAAIGNNIIKKHSKNFIKSLKENNIFVDTYLGEGAMTLENISKIVEVEKLNNLSAANSTVNIFVAGQCVYIMMFIEIPYALKIENKDLSYVFHFLFDNLKISE
ncbi:MAG: hypothetical protein N4A38_00445 [Candidatus Gracilibacteria bacterium]|nr:hypothetical protein [Candidatus Gracilibacteria bacterium]